MQDRTWLRIDLTVALVVVQNALMLSTTMPAFAPISRALSVTSAIVGGVDSLEAAA